MMISILLSSAAAFADGGLCGAVGRTVRDAEVCPQYSNTNAETCKKADGTAWCGWDPVVVVAPKPEPKPEVVGSGKCLAEGRVGGEDEVCAKYTNTDEATCKRADGWAWCFWDATAKEKSQADEDAGAAKIAPTGLTPRSEIAAKPQVSGQTATR